jgi:2-hydroxy-6-oxonona-2,4-dienedioate hydrolase
MARVSAASRVAHPEALGSCEAAWSVARRVDVRGRAVRYREAGSGPAIVLVHGLGVSADYWWRNGPPLAAAGFRVLAPDLPGFGHTEGPSGLSVPDQAAALLAWADALEITTAVYVGHSLSCQTILQLAADHPSRVAGLALAAPTGDPRPHRLLHQALALFMDIPRESFRLALEVGWAYLLAGPRRIWRTWRMGAGHDPIALLPCVHVPACVLLGTRDPVVPHEFADELARGLHAEIRWIEGAAHACIFTHAPEFNREVLGLLEEVGRAG